MITYDGEYIVPRLHVMVSRLSRITCDGRWIILWLRVMMSHWGHCPMITWWLHMMVITEFILPWLNVVVSHRVHCPMITCGGESQSSLSHHYMWWVRVHCPMITCGDESQSGLSPWSHVMWNEWSVPSLHLVGWFSSCSTPRFCGCFRSRIAPWLHVMTNEWVTLAKN